MFTKNMELKDRIRAVREDACLSRKQLGEMTKIPARTIEKFELGSQDITLPRIEAISQALGIDVDTLTGKAPVEAIDPPSENVEQYPDYVNSILELDKRRSTKFVNAIRSTIVIVEGLAVELQALEPTELFDLAESREINIDDFPALEKLDELFISSMDEAQEICEEIENRIIDTAVFGHDLYAIQAKALRNAASLLSEDEEIEFEITTTAWAGTGLFGLGDHYQFVPGSREAFRMAMLTGRLDFTDREIFPIAE